MINYAKILLAHEKDNPSKFLRGTYIMSNVGDLIKCYGRMIRFPDDAHIYEKEMQLALGDVIIQCRMYMEENNNPLFNVEINVLSTQTPTEIELAFIAKHAAMMIDENEARINHAISILTSAMYLCTLIGWDFKVIEHLGFIHTIERFEDFERNGWK